MTVPEFIYTVVLRPAPLRSLANACLKAVIPAKLQRHGATIVLNPGDPVISGALTFNVYEKTETEFILRVCRPGMNFLDIGANVGYYTALALTKLEGKGSIVCLEPDPVTFHFLQKTIAENPHREIVKPLQKAASDHSGVMTLYTSLDNRGDNRLYANELAQDSVQVEVITIDQVAEELALPYFDFIKIDVQGYEGRVLKGMRATLRNAPRTLLISEFWPYGLECAGTKPEAYLAELAELGMTLFELAKGGKLKPIRNYPAFIGAYPGRRYTNIVAMKGTLAEWGITDCA